jgi:hypothetical protein
MSETSIVIVEINPKKPQSEEVKWAKAKYYSKKKLDPEFMEQNRNKTKEYYIHNTERHQNKCNKEYYLEHKSSRVMYNLGGGPRFAYVSASARHAK